MSSTSLPADGAAAAPAMPAAGAAVKPPLTFWQIWNMCFGFLGIQMGFALQNANVSRIFQTLGAEIDAIPILWVAAPVTGLLVQPVIGWMSDRTWNSLGRRRPYFLWGAILASLALIAMPNSPTLWIAAGMLWIMDASINVAMEPFRAFVGDMLPEEQRPRGFATQSFFIGIGAVVASALPWMLTNWFDVANTAPEGVVPPSVHLSFYIGAIAFFGAVMWTVFRTKEYSPEELAAFEQARPASHRTLDATPKAPGYYRNMGLGWLVAGGALTAWVVGADLDQQLFILSVGGMAFGALLVGVSLVTSEQGRDTMVYGVIHDLFHMPRAMRQLAVVQFFAWFALFAMWIYTTAAVTAHHYGSTDPTTAAYNDGADWVGILFAAYNGFAALAALAIPPVAARLGCRKGHLVNLCLGGAGLASFILIDDPAWLLLPMVGVGIAWASILSLPYVLLSNSLPTPKLGVYMGIFNFFIVIPQIVAASVLGLVVRDVFGGEAIWGLVAGGVLMVFAGVACLFVDAAAEPA